MAAGLFESSAERRDPVVLTNITGKVPAWLQGTVVRNVQGLFEQGPDEVYHWNDGLTGIHLIKIDGNTITHLNKRLNTTSYDAAVTTNGLPFVGYATPANGGKRPRGGRDPHTPFKGPYEAKPVVEEEVSQCDLCCSLRPLALAAACCRSSCGSTCPCSGASEISLEEATAAAEAYTNGELDADIDRSSPAARKLLGGGKQKPYAWNPGVDVARVGDKCLALTDQNLYTAFDCDTAETTDQQWKFDDSKNSIISLSAAHWRYDPATKTHYDFIANFGFPPLTQNTFSLWRWKEGTDGMKRDFFATIKAPNMTFVHSFHLTDKYILFTRPPAHYSFVDLVFKRLTPYNATFVDPTVPVKFHIVDRETGENVADIDGNTWLDGFDTVAKESPFRGPGPGWFHTHTVNAYEAANGTIIADYCAYPDMGIFYGDMLLNVIDNPRDYMRTILPARLVRCLIDPVAKSSTCYVVNDKTYELPTFNMERNTGKEYRYSYASSAVGMESDFVDQLVKVDHQTGAVTHEWHDHSGGHWFVNEPVFIANPEGTEEDDGVLTCAVYDAAADTSSLLILSAKDFTELARVNLGVKMQAHFHGKFCKSFGDRICVGL